MPHSDTVTHCTGVVHEAATTGGENKIPEGMLKSPSVTFNSGCVCPLNILARAENILSGQNWVWGLASSIWGRARGTGQTTTKISLFKTSTAMRSRNPDLHMEMLMNVPL